MTNDDDPMEGEHIPRSEKYAPNTTHSAPAAPSVTSAFTSWTQIFDFKNKLTTEEYRTQLVKLKAELNIALTDLIDTEIQKNAALQRLSNMEFEIQRVAALDAVEQEILMLDANARLYDARKALEKSKGGYKKQKRKTKRR